MCEYIPNTFTIHLPDAEGWEELAEILEAVGYKKTYCTKLFTEEIKPIQPLSEPACLKFYQNWQYSGNKPTNL